MTNKMTVQELQAKIDKHEEICSIRWAEILGRVKRLELIILGSAGTIIIMLGNLLLKGLG
tara:strand:+ start:561 stop:740 length:180 start_codon:yes stop_codon:yes gene_type:complete